MSEIHKKERVTWADVCKGLLITLLMFSHLVWVSQSNYGINNSVITLIGKYNGIWNCFFMSCFFIVSGMFSNFNKPFKTFVWAQFKALIIPALVFLSITTIPSLNYSYFIERTLLYGGGIWFLTAMFLSKLFMWFCLKFVKKERVILLILLAMSFVGKWLDDANLCPNYWYHRNFLNFTLFLGLGYYFKDYILKNVVGIVSAIAFLITIIVLFVMHAKIPNVVAIFNESLSQHPLTIWLSVTGSITCIHLCKLINHNSVLEFLGRNSLIVYIYHMMFLSHAISAVAVSLNSGAFVDSSVIVFMIIVGTLGFCSAIALLMDFKYLRWMKGVF